MKQFTRILAALVFASLVIFISCKKKKGGDPDPLEERAKLFASATWVPGTINLKNEGEREEWADFKLTFTNNYNAEQGAGQYILEGVPSADGADAVLGANGTHTWRFEESNKKVILVDIGNGEEARLFEIAVSTEQIFFQVLVDGSGSRVAGFEGTWIFNLTAQP